MRAKIWRDWLLAAFGSLLAVGCEKAAVTPDLPPDPILVNKRPVQGKHDAAPTFVMVQKEPTTPALPESALVHAPSGLSAVARTTAAKPLSPPPQPGPRLDPPAEAPRPATPQPAIGPTLSPPPPAKHRPVSGQFGRGADYGWLQGVVDKHYSGHVHLRFCDASVEDEWGGKVCLADDEKLKTLKSGDVVFVEGELVKAASAESKRGHGDRYPLYRVRYVERVPGKP